MQTFLRRQAVAHGICTMGILAILSALLLVACVMIFSVFGVHIADRI